MRIMYDGINTDAETIARLKPAMVAYYVDGRYAWTEQQIRLFPRAKHVTITVLGSITADVADCETGDLTPAHAADWVRNKRARGYYRPTVYCSYSAIPAVRNATGALRLGVDYDIWYADYDNAETQLYPGTVAKQYRNTALMDESVVWDDAWPHRSPPVKTVEPAWPSGDVLKLGSTGAAVYVLQQAFHNSGITGVRGITEDGDYGEQTRTACRNFEKDQRLTVDTGVAGTQIRNRLISLGLLNQAGEYTG
jgi:hypothetical protein